MAHFARMENNFVKEVIVINNEVLENKIFPESESIGQAFCSETFGGNWLQTSYTGSFRGRFAGVGMIYDPANDEFIYPE